MSPTTLTLTLNPAVAAARRAAKASNPCPPITPVPQTPPAPPSASPARVPVSSILARLQDRWPHLFDPADPKPLAIGIHKQIKAAGGFSGKELSRALKVWTGRRAYIKQVARSALRHGIDGTTTYITSAQTAHAREHLTSPLPKDANP